ncbi:M10 family metallopeptidase C-terminal domain-containing protein [Paracoccus aerius]
MLLAEAGNDFLSGGEGNDVLNGGTGNDTLIGGEGSDRFVFNGGTDRIRDFENGDDEIDLSSFAGFNSFASIRAAASQSGSDVIIKAGAHRLVIEDTRLNQLDGDDFIW